MKIQNKMYVLQAWMELQYTKISIVEVDSDRNSSRGTCHTFQKHIVHML